MIKQNDTATITLLLLISLVALIYALMFFYANTAEAFIARLGGDFAQQGESGYFWMRQIGIIYVALAIGNIIALMAPPEQCTVYYSAMLVGSVTFPDGGNPLLAFFIVLNFIVFLTIFFRNQSNF